MHRYAGETKEEGESVETVGTVATLVGLALAIFTMIRTGRIVLWTRRAVVHTSKQLGVYTLLVLVPELTLIEHKLDEAVQAENREATRRLLREWREKASEFGGLLRTEPVAADTLQTIVQESISGATLAKQRLDNGVDLVKALGPQLNTCGKVCSESRALAAQIRSTPLALNAARHTIDELRELYFSKDVEEGPLKA